MSMFYDWIGGVSFQISSKGVEGRWSCYVISRLFQISGAAALTALAPAAVLTRGTVRRLWSAECSDHPEWYDEMSHARYAGWWDERTFNVNDAILKSIQDFIGSQCNCLNFGVIWSRRCRLATTRAWVFCTIWSFNMFLLEHYRLSYRIVPRCGSPIEYWPVNILHSLLYLLLASVRCGIVLVYDSMRFKMVVESQIFVDCYAEDASRIRHGDLGSSDVDLR